MASFPNLTNSTRVGQTLRQTVEAHKDTSDGIGWFCFVGLCFHINTRKSRHNEKYDYSHLDLAGRVVFGQQCGTCRAACVTPININCNTTFYIHLVEPSFVIKHYFLAN
jgi:hypothetical protein